VRDVMQRAYDSGRHARRGLFRVVDDVRACVDARPKHSKFEHVRVLAYLLLYLHC
jgi:hypothetical protein